MGEQTFYNDVVSKLIHDEVALSAQIASTWEQESYEELMPTRDRGNDHPIEGGGLNDEEDEGEYQNQACDNSQTIDNGMSNVNGLDEERFHRNHTIGDNRNNKQPTQSGLELVNQQNQSGNPNRRFYDTLPKILDKSDSIDNYMNRNETIRRHVAKCFEDNDPNSTRKLSQLFVELNEAGELLGLLTNIHKTFFSQSTPQDNQIPGITSLLADQNEFQQQKQQEEVYFDLIPTREELSFGFNGFITERRFSVKNSLAQDQNSREPIVLINRSKFTTGSTVHLPIKLVWNTNFSRHVQNFESPPETLTALIKLPMKNETMIQEIVTLKKQATSSLQIVYIEQVGITITESIRDALIAINNSKVINSVVRFEIELLKNNFLTAPKAFVDFRVANKNMFYDIRAMQFLTNSKINDIIPKKGNSLSNVQLILKTVSDLEVTFTPSKSSLSVWFGNEIARIQSVNWIRGKNVLQVNVLAPLILEGSDRIVFVRVDSVRDPIQFEYIDYSASTSSTALNKRMSAPDSEQPPSVIRRIH
ncbi:hypothetical protein AKO1_015712 [Acrasis kona]|uniref:Uncharacterized protein n=1 Tax=Acrasis kona TaxID=1008807 RepID=A0AAW2ZGU1_9EUKA